MVAVLLNEECLEISRHSSTAGARLAGAKLVPVGGVLHWEVRGHDIHGIINGRLRFIIEEQANGVV